MILNRRVAGLEFVGIAAQETLLDFRIPFAGFHFYRRGDRVGFSVRADSDSDVLSCFRCNEHDVALTAGRFPLAASSPIV